MDLGSDFTMKNWIKNMLYVKVRQHISIGYRGRNDLKFDMNKVQHLYFQLEKESTNSDRWWNRYTASNMDSGHVLQHLRKRQCAGLKTITGSTYRLETKDQNTSDWAENWYAHNRKLQLSNKRRSDDFRLDMNKLCRLKHGLKPLWIKSNSLKYFKVNVYLPTN